MGRLIPRRGREGRNEKRNSKKNKLTKVLGGRRKRALTPSRRAPPEARIETGERGMKSTKPGADTA